MGMSNYVAGKLEAALKDYADYLSGGLIPF